MDFELGKIYSGYKFLDVERRSKRGVEYRVLNTLAQRVEILRALPETAQDDLEQTERFLREMRVRARLIHPNILTLFNAFELERQLVMTTELVEGPAMSERLELGAIPWRDAAALMGQALTAVGFAHGQNIIHRDINPENIIIGADGVVKLANFGLAKVMNGPKLTQSGAVIGNVKYISPEQVKGTSELDLRSDLYSLGVVFYHMLCGCPPFDSPSQFEVMLAHVNSSPRPPSMANLKVPAELDAVLLKALAKEPSQRYATAADFEAALDAAVCAAEPSSAAAAPAKSFAGNPPHLPMPPLLEPAFLTGAKPGSPALEWLFYGGLAAGASVLLGAIWLVAK